MDLQLSGKVALITGSSRGIGAATAAVLSREGAFIAINYLTGAVEATALMEQIQQNGGRAATYQADVSKPKDVERMVGGVMEEFGRIDILVNNAGITTHTKSIADFTPEDMQKCIDVNLNGIMNCIKAVVPQMKERRYGKIINVVSYRAYATRIPSPYDISKSAALALTVEAAIELAPYNINVVSVSPGTAATEMNLEKLDTPEKLKAMEDTVPIGRLAAPEEIADLICFLASDRAKHITGTDILITGGEIFRW